MNSIYIDKTILIRYIVSNYSESLHGIIKQNIEFLFGKTWTA